MQHSYGAIGTPSVGHHRWRPLSRRSIDTGRGPFNRTARVLLHEMLWRRPPPQHGLRTAAAFASLLLHVLVFGAMLLAPPPGPPPVVATSGEAIEVRFIEPEPPPPPPPPPPKLQKLPPRAKPAPKQVAAQAVPKPSSARAPELQPVPLPTQAAPRISLDIQPTVAVPPPGAPQPVQRPQAAPPEPVLQAVAAPPPPKIVVEPSAMAVPPPPVQVEQLQPATVPSVRLQPVPVTQPQAVTGAPQLAVTLPDALPASLQPVERPQAIAPSPELAAVRLPAPALPQVTLETAAPSARPAPPDVQPVAPALRAPDAELAEVPVAPQFSSVPEVDVPSTLPEVADVAVPSPAPLPEVATTTATPAEQAATPEASATSAPQETQAPAEASAQTSWAKPSDQFAPAPEHSADGKPNPLERYDRNGKPSAPPQSTGTHGEGGESGNGSKSGEYVQLYPRGNSDVMGRRSSRVDYQPTLFEQYWAPQNESVLDTWLRHFVEKFTYKHTFDLGRGVHVNCVIGPMALFFSCGGDGPSAASAKSNDPRLNMAPANPLVPDLAPPATAPNAPPQSSRTDVQCQVARVAGGPPPPGCPGAPVQPSKSDQW